MEKEEKEIPILVRARACEPPFHKHVLIPIGNDDGTLSVQDFEGRYIATNLSAEQYESFKEAFLLGFSSGVAMEREALIFEFTNN